MPSSTVSFLLTLSVSFCAFAQVTRPATQPTTFPSRPSAEEMLSQMLRPTTQAAKPLMPVPDAGGGVVDRTTTFGAVAPGAHPMNLIPEGTIITDRVGRLAQTPDGSWQFAFEADGRSMSDPPILVLPNKMLQRMQMTMTGGNDNIQFRITGEVTEFNNRNYILVQKASQVADLAQPLK